MYEWCIDGIVIDREDAGEADARLTLYTKEFGRISARAKSIRKITSKLSAHLGVGDLSKIRLVGKSEDARHLQLVDALRLKKLNFSGEVLSFLRDITFDGEADERLWNTLKKGEGDTHTILEVLGLNPALAWCTHCMHRPVSYFLTASHSFACHGCILKIGGNEVLYEI